MLPAVRALILHGPGDLRLDEVPAPRPGPGEIVVEVLAAVTCATDAKMARSGAHPALGPLPAGLGHEVAGRVAEAGAGVAWPAPGDEVVVANSAPCGECRPCRAGRPNLCADMAYLTGAYAERLLVPARIVTRNVHALPRGPLPGRRGAGGAVRLRAPLRAAGPGDVEGRLVLVLGGGFQGRMLAGLLAGAGARVHLADPHPERRAAAARAGVEATHEAPRDAAGADLLRAALPGGEGADLVVEAVGRPETWEAAVSLARAGRRGADARGVPGRVGGEPADPPDSLFGGHDPRLISPHPGRISPSARGVERSALPDRRRAGRADPAGAGGGGATGITG